MTGGSLEHNRIFLGTARIQLQHLIYVQYSQEHDECIGCSISDLEHSIPALITLADYDDALAFSRVSLDDIYCPGAHPKLELKAETRLSCLHGRFRIETAKRNVERHEEWWSVDLYDSSLLASVRRSLEQHYRRHVPLCDGEKYLRIRIFQRHKQHRDERLWIEQLSISKAKNLRQIIRTPWLVSLLDDLETFRPLWQNFQLASFPLILSWHCDEEVERYLKTMFIVWISITDGHGYWCDEATVKTLQGLAPRWSNRDQQSIRAAFEDGTVFSRVKDMHIRQRLLSRVLLVESFIPTFKTFFKHSKLIGPVMIRLRELFAPIKPRPTVRTMFSNNYVGFQKFPGQCMLQVSERETSVIELPQSSSAKYAFLQLCLFVIRHHESMTRSELEKEGDLDECLPKYPGWLVRLGHFADKLGYESLRIQELCKQNPDLCDIKRHMRYEKPSAQFAAGSEDFHSEAVLRHGRQHTIFKFRPKLPTASMSVDVESQTVDKGCMASMFLPSILEAIKCPPKCFITDFGMRVLTFTAFFGDIDDLRHQPTDGSVSGYSKNSYSWESHRKEGAVPLQSSENFQAQRQSQYIRATSIQPSICCSSYYSPAHPSTYLTFWHLPHAEDTVSRPRQLFRTPIKEDAIQKAVTELRKLGRNPKFLLLHKQRNQLMLYDPSALFSHFTQSQNSEQKCDVYVTFEEDRWIGRSLELQESSNVWVEESNPWKN